MKNRLLPGALFALLAGILLVLFLRTGAKPPVPPSPVVPGCTFLPGPKDPPGGTGHR